MRRFFNRQAALSVNKRFRKILRLLHIMIVPLAVVFAPACSRKIYMPMESIKIQRDTVRTIRAYRDSVIIKDSVIIVSRNDTVCKESYRWRFRDRVVRDTLLKTHLDTVYIEKHVPAASTVDNGVKATVWQRFSSALRNSLLSSLLLIIFLFILHRLLRPRK